MIFNAMINNEITRNFIFQLKFQNLNFSFFVKINVKLCTINNISLHVYKKDNLRVNVTNANEKTKKFI